MTLNELRAQARQKAREQAVNARELLEHMMAGAAGDDERVAASEAAAHIFSMQPHTRMAQMQVAEPLVLAALEVLTADRLAETIQAEGDDGEGLVDACRIFVQHEKALLLGHGYSVYALVRGEMVLVLLNL